MTDQNNKQDTTAELYRKRRNANIAIMNRLQELIYLDKGARFGQILAWAGLDGDRFDEEPWESLSRFEQKMSAWKVKE